MLACRGVPMNQAIHSSSNARATAPEKVALLVKSVAPRATPVLPTTGAAAPLAKVAVHHNHAVPVATLPRVTTALSVVG